MKRNFILIALLVYSLFCLHAEDFIEVNNKKISLNHSIEQIQKEFGEQKELSFIPLENNSEWDTLCYKYDSFTVYSYRITKMPFKIEAFNKEFKISVDGCVIQNGSPKQEVESKLEKLEYIGKDKVSQEYYLYYLPDNIEAGFVFDINHKLISSYISYVPMD